MTGRWDVRWHYEVTVLASLPRARDDLHEPCMAGAAWLRRIRWLIARRTRSDCCRYHRVDWRAVNAAAVPVARQAEASGTQPEDLDSLIDAASRGLAGNELEAVRDLFIPGAAIEVNDDDPRDRYLQEGNHRVTAMRDARARRTVTLRAELTEAGLIPGSSREPRGAAAAPECAAGLQEVGVGGGRRLRLRQAEDGAGQRERPAQQVVLVQLLPGRNADRWISAGGSGRARVRAGMGTVTAGKHSRHLNAAWVFLT